MQAGERHEFQEPSMGRVGLTRGLIVILAAVVVGSFLLIQGRGDDGNLALSADAASDTDGEAAVDLGATPGGDGNGAEEEPTPVTDATVSVAVDDGSRIGVDEGELAFDSGDESAAPIDPPTAPIDAPVDASGPPSPNGVTVLVLNGGSAPGTAGRGAQVLKAEGYTVLPPRNADTVLASTVLHVGGREAEALAVAATLTADPAALVAALDPAAPPLKDYGSADVIVVIGPDDLIDLPGG